MASLLINQGVIFQGEFDNGYCSSIGKLLYPDGDIYFGQHKLFVKDGVGKMVYINGSIYEGRWESDRKNYEGRMQYKETGDVYVGEFHEGKRSGNGRYYQNSDHTIYEGEWTNDRRQGEGKILNAEGQIASGDFRADQMEGTLVTSASEYGIIHDRIWCKYAFRHFKRHARDWEEGYADVVYFLRTESEIDSMAFRRVIDIVNPSFLPAVPSHPSIKDRSEEDEITFDFEDAHPRNTEIPSDTVST